MIKYSFIIATKNSEKRLKRALGSIFKQTYPNYEIILQDACSTDKTLDIAREYPNISVVSEPDAGVYDAWNKAFDRVTGDWVMFMGSDDMLLDENVLAGFHVHIKKLLPAVVFVYAGVIWGVEGKPDGIQKHTLDKMYHAFLTNMGMQFSATFIRARIFDHERFDTSYKIAGDFDFAARLLNGENASHLPMITSYMERGGLSTDLKHNCLLRDERAAVLARHIIPRARELAQYSMNHLWD